jgi:hypothetical protein
MSVNTGPCVGGPLAGQTLTFNGTTYTKYREADHLNLDGGEKTYSREIGHYAFSAGSWTWTQTMAQGIGSGYNHDSSNLR